MDKPFTSFQYSDRIVNGGKKMSETIRCPECETTLKRGHGYETICPKCGLVIETHFAEEKMAYPVVEEYLDIRERPIKHKGGN